MKPAVSRATQIADDIEKSPLGNCGPSDDPDKQYAYVAAFRDIARRFVAAVKRIGDAELSSMVADLNTSPEGITDAHELRADLSAVIDALKEVAHDSDHAVDVADNEISELTRRAIVDFLSSSAIHWAGRLQEDDFLARLYDLSSMRSTDHRMSNAASDIYQHRVNWQDWEDDWVFYDTRFNLLRAPDGEFLRFLCEVVHPVVRPDVEAARNLVAAFNRELAADGWSLAEAKQISGRPVFAPQKIGQRTQVFEDPTGWQKVDRQLQEVRLRLGMAEFEERCQEVGLLCREVLISVAQEVYDRDRHASQDDVAPSDTDAGRMLEAFFTAELAGGGNQEARADAKAALRLALALQHKRTADFRMAALCAEATSSVVNILAVLSGRRGRSL